MKHKVFVVLGIGILIGIIIFLFLFNLRWWSLTVKVTLGDTQPQPNAKVLIYAGNIRIPIMAGRTDTNGLITFPLPEGTYLIKASYRSFMAQLSPHQGQSFLELKSNQTLHIPLRGGV